MPQFDKLTFLSQLFWFFLFFLSLYFITLKHYLPAIGQSLKLRKKTIQWNQSEAAKAKEEMLTLSAHGAEIWCETLIEAKECLQRNNVEGKSWLLLKAKETNEAPEGPFNQVNKEYVRTVGELVGKEWLAKRAVRR